MENKSEINNSPSKNNQEIEIDLLKIIRDLWNGRIKILKFAGIAAIVGLIVAFSLPRQYTVNVTLAPESGKASGGGMAGVASMLGMSNMNIGGGDADALNTSLFPDIASSTPFILELFDTKVKQKKGDTLITLYNYLDEQKLPWWSTILKLPGMAIGGIKSIFSPQEIDNSKKIDPFQLTQKQAEKVDALRKAILISIDKKSGITTVGVTLQDPIVTAVVTDTVMAKLQEYITKYKVSKAQEDCDYLSQLYSERQKEYYSAQQAYANYVDANRNVVLQSVLNERERLQNDMSLAYQVYSQVATQLQVARAKVQEAKPVFAVVEPASIPLRPSGTSKMIILIGFIFIGVLVGIAWVLLGESIWKNLKTSHSIKQ